MHTVLHLAVCIKMEEGHQLLTHPPSPLVTYSMHRQHGRAARRAGAVLQICGQKGILHAEHVIAADHYKHYVLGQYYTQDFTKVVYWI